MSWGFLLTTPWKSVPNLWKFMQTKDVKMKSQVNFELDPNGERQLTNTVILGLLLLVWLKTRIRSPVFNQCLQLLHLQPKRTKCLTMTTIKQAASHYHVFTLWHFWWLDILIRAMIWECLHCTADPKWLFALRGRILSEGTLKQEKQSA